MFPRTALVIVAVFALLFITVVVRGALIARQGRSVADCNRGIAQPYQQLLVRMRQLADAGESEQLRALIVRAQERSGDLSTACAEPSEDGVYAKQVREITQ